MEDGPSLTADVVVSNADAAFLHKEMIPREHQSLRSRLKLKAAHYSMGLYVLYFGTKRQYPDVVYTIWFGKRYRPLLDDIFHKKVLADDFSLCLHRPTAPTRASRRTAATASTCSARCPTSRATSTGRRGPVRDRIVGALGDSILPGLRDDHGGLLHDARRLQAGLPRVNGAGFWSRRSSGSLRGSASTTAQRASCNLYLVGAGTRGARMPGACSAKVLDELVPAAVS